MLILEDLCGAVGNPADGETATAAAESPLRPPTIPGPAAAPTAFPAAEPSTSKEPAQPPTTGEKLGMAAVAIETSAPPEQTWSNLLPRPSQLFDMGQFDSDDTDE